jgi:hypothetical protein
MRLRERELISYRPAEMLEDFWLIYRFLDGTYRGDFRTSFTTFRNSDYPVEALGFWFCCQWKIGHCITNWDRYTRYLHENLHHLDSLLQIQSWALSQDESIVHLDQKLKRELGVCACYTMLSYHFDINFSREMDQRTVGNSNEFYVCFHMCYSIKSPGQTSEIQISGFKYLITYMLLIVSCYSFNSYLPVVYWFRSHYHNLRQN